MRRLLVAAAGIVGLGAGALIVGSGASQAKDYGQAGQAFPVIEPDLLATIEARLKRLEASGELARTNAAFAERAKQRIRRPVPVAGISPAKEDRTWDFDPTITIENDIRDNKGNLIAARGQTVNPLDFVTVKQDLVFVDGDDDAQMAWATARYGDLKAKIILVSGSPIEEMTARKRRFYFDQEGKLTAKFGIQHTPAIVTQTGKVMKVTELLLKKARAG